MNRTVIVAIAGKNQVDNLYHLPPTFTFKHKKDTVKVVIHDNPNFTFQGTTFSANFDVLVSCLLGPSVDNPSLAPSNITDVNLVRLSKPEQMMLLAKVVAEKDLALSNYLPIPSYFTMESFSKKGLHKSTWAFGGEMNLDRFHVLKCKHGARGIGQYVFDPKHTSIDVLTTILMDANTKDGQIKDLLPGVIFGNEDSFKEGLDAICSQGGFIQEIIPDIVDEYRLLVIDDEIHHFGKRKRSLDIYPQATGVHKTLQANGELQNSWADIDGLVKENVVEIKALVRELGIRLGSVDIFTTKDGKWGIFEWSNQFGTAAFNPVAQQMFHMKAVETWVKKHLDK